VILGRVIGEVWATRRDARLGRAKLLVVRPHGIYEPAFDGGDLGRHLVATDDMHAGVGDEVIVCLGAPARASAGGNDTPVDAAVLGVADRVDFEAGRMTAPGAGPGIRRPLTVILPGAVGVASVVGVASAVGVAGAVSGEVRR
jgi:ethanolamine utilization protein EutN